MSEQTRPAGSGTESGVAHAPGVEQAGAPESWSRTWLIGVSAFAVAVLLVYTLPLGDESASRPDVQRMLVAAIAIAAVTTAALFAIIRYELRLPSSVALLCVLFNALIVGVKFVAGPNAVYEANAQRVFEAEVSLNDAFGGWLAAGLVFALYAAALYVVYRLARSRTGIVVTRAGSAGRSTLAVVLSVLVVLAALAATGIGLLLAVIGLSAGLDYLGYVFGSAGALVVAVTLAVAAAAARAAFRRAGDVAQAAQDVGALVALFWVCLAFLAVYHVLWVVYILLITSLWPLKVVTPK